MINAMKASALLTVAAATTTAIALVGTDSASAHTTRHTMHLTSRQLQDHMVGDIDVSTDKDTQHGAVTGYDVTSCRINTTTHTANCSVALARSNGILLAHVSTNLNNGRGKGTVLGGTRAFHGATGTVTLALPHVTIVWNN